MGEHRDDLPAGSLHLLILKTLQRGPSHGYAIAEHIRQSSDDVLQVEEGSLYPALQRMLLKGWVTAAWGVSDTNRKVRLYTLTPDGRKQLQQELARHRRVSRAMDLVLGRA